MEPNHRGRLGVVLLLLLGGTTCVLALPFLRGDPVVWAERNAELLAGTLSLTAAVFVHGVLTTSWRRATLFFTLAFGVSLLAEYAGVHTGMPFGRRYHYHVDIEPRLLGTVPLFIPLAWYVIAATPLVFLRELRVREGGRLIPRRYLLKVGLCALYLVATDTFLDPLSVAVDAWTWEGDGAFFGVPLSNFGGWLAVGVVLFGLYLPFEDGVQDRAATLDAAYTLVAILLTMLGFAAVIGRVGHASPVVLASVVLLPTWVFWWRTRSRVEAHAERTATR